MIPWEFIESARVPGSTEELHLYRRGEEYSIRVDRQELMNSRVYGSEDALAELSCARVAGRTRARVLIGGLGMGYTAAAALRLLRADARVVVAELVPAVVAWNRGCLSHLAGHPLKDARLTVREDDVGLLLRAGRSAWDAIMLDVDNGPQALTRKANDWLYTPAGLDAASRALRPGGVLAVWSAGPDRAFTRRLRRAGFQVDESRVKARGSRGGSSYTIWLAARPS